jgi:tripartite-type tricarboxylate transporter receptor subunit TctC
VAQRTGWIAGACIAATAWAAQAATPTDRYPAKPIRLVVPLTAGGPTDILARIVSVPLGERLGQQVVVDNRPGAGGNIGAEIAARAAPDGYTLFMGTSGPLSINTSLYPKLAYDPVRDFAPVILAASAPFVVCIHPSTPASNIREFVALAKAKPGALNYGSVPGSASHLATELFKHSAGINVQHIPYKGAAPATTDLIAGQIQLSLASTPGAVPQVKGGKLKALAVTSPKRIGPLPDVPTVSESGGDVGLRGYEASVWYGVVAPARTPREIVLRLNAEIDRIVKERGSREKMIAGDFDPTSTSPDEFGAYIRSETAKWARVVKLSGARAE